MTAVGNIEEIPILAGVEMVLRELRELRLSGVAKERPARVGSRVHGFALSRNHGKSRQGTSGTFQGSKAGRQQPVE